MMLMESISNNQIEDYNHPDELIKKAMAELPVIKNN